MKSMMKILARYVVSATAVALILLVLNLAVLAAWTLQGKGDVTSEYLVSEIAASLTNQNGRFVLSETGQEALQKHYQWAMLLDNSGHITWSSKLPLDLPQHYTIAQVAGFSRWYLNDYPVYAWRHQDGLLVLGRAKGTVWKQSIELPENIMANLPAWFMGAIILNGAVAVLLALLLGLHLFRALQPVANGIEALADKQPVRLSTGGLLGDLAAKLNQTSAQLLRQETALKKRDTARTSWIAGVSHDIRTPLSMVMGYASQLEESPKLPQAEREQARIIRRQSERIKTLVNDLNLASKLEYDMQPLRATLIYPAALVRGVVADFLNSGLDDGYFIDLNVEKGVQSAVLTGDKELLRRAVSNLIGNSIRHNPNGCTITVIVETGQAQCLITVADNGVGFPAQVLATLNQPDRPADGRNHGLGLTIVRQITQAHGGTAEFNNLSEGGCIAVLRLPVIAPEH